MGLHLELSRLRPPMRGLATMLAETTFVPLGLFYAFYLTVGIWWSLAAALGWCYGLLSWKLLRRRPVPGLLVLQAALLTVRTAVSVLSGSVFLYFASPVIGTALIGLLFVGSALLGRPITARLARDLLAFPDTFWELGWVGPFFARITVIWGAERLLEAGWNLWAVTTVSPATYMAMRYVGNYTLLAGALSSSVWLFTRWARRHHLSWSWRTPAPVGAA